MTSKVRKPKALRGTRTRLAEEVAGRYAQTGARMLSDDVPQRLDPRTAAEMATLTGAAPEDVRVHTGTRAGRMADRLGARAFTLAGGDVFFAKDAFQPDTPGGKALLAHEMTHVAEGVAGRSGSDAPRSDDESEQEARRTEERVLAQEDTRRPETKEEFAEPVDVAVDGSGGGGASRQSVRIDKTVLEDKVHRVIERAIRRDQERSGR